MRILLIEDDKKLSFAITEQLHILLLRWGNSLALRSESRPSL